MSSPYRLSVAKRGLVRVGAVASALIRDRPSMDSGTAQESPPVGIGGEEHTAGAERPASCQSECGNPENFFGDEESARPVIVFDGGLCHFAL